MTVLSARANISSNLFEFHSYVLLVLVVGGIYFTLM